MTRRTRYWLLQAGGWSAYSAVGLVAAARNVGWSVALVAAFGLYCLYSIGLTDAFRRVTIRRRWLDPATRWRWSWIAAGVLTIVAIQVVLVVSISFLLMPGVARWRLPDLAALAWGTMLMTATWTALYVRLTERQREREREIAMTLSLREAELRALQQQLNPHFLFNCLNSIRALVIEDPPRAQEMITRLARMLRYSLARQTRDTVPLAAEMEMTADYLALEAVRFEERLQVHVHVDPAVRDFQIPPMLLPTLVENAVTHGIACDPSGGSIDIRAAGDGTSLRLEVSNTGGIREPRTEAIGLANVRERLRLLYGDAARFTLAPRDSTHVVATVVVPDTPCAR